MLVQIRVFRDEDGAWCASGVDHGIHTQGGTLDELYANIEEAAQLHFEEELAAGRTVDMLIVAEKELVGAPAPGR
jgi:predicted RNase H-like HicB family nuclease